MTPAQPMLGIKGVAYRLADETDRAFVISSWLRSYRRSLWARELDPRAYDGGQVGLIERLWPMTQVAHPEGDPLTILGWACGDSNVLHYAYVKGELRRAGLGAALVGIIGQPKIYTHRTPLGESITRGMLYNPYLIWEALCASVK